MKIFIFMIDFLSSLSSSVFKAQKKKKTRIDEQAAYANQLERKIIDGNRDKYIYTGTQTIFKDN